MLLCSELKNDVVVGRHTANIVLLTLGPYDGLWECRSGDDITLSSRFLVLGGKGRVGGIEELDGLTPLHIAGEVINSVGGIGGHDELVGISLLGLTGVILALPEQQHGVGGTALSSLHLEVLLIGCEAHLGLGEVDGENGNGLTEALEGDGGHPKAVFLGEDDRGGVTEGVDHGEVNIVPGGHSADLVEGGALNGDGVLHSVLGDDLSIRLEDFTVTDVLDVVEGRLAKEESSKDLGNKHVGTSREVAEVKVGGEHVEDGDLVLEVVLGDVALCKLAHLLATLDGHDPLSTELSGHHGQKSGSGTDLQDTSLARDDVSLQEVVVELVSGSIIHHGIVEVVDGLDEGSRSKSNTIRNMEVAIELTAEGVTVILSSTWGDEPSGLGTLDGLGNGGRLSVSFSGDGGGLGSLGHGVGGLVVLLSGHDCGCGRMRGWL